MSKVRKKFHTRGLALILSVLLTGCAVAGETTPQLPASETMPPVLSEGIEGEGSFTAELYFRSEDGLRLVAETREISYTGNISRAQAVMEALAQGPGSSMLHASLPGNMDLDRVELSTDACNVYLLSSYVPSAQEWFIARAAVAATIYEAEGVGSVNLYLNGVEPGVNRQALGALAPITERLDTYVANMLQEFENWYSQEGTEAGSFATRTATLYFTDFEGELLIARNSTVNYDRTEDAGGIAALLVAKLRDGDLNLEPVVPADLTLAERPLVTPLEQVQSALWPESGEEADSPHPQDPEQAESGESIITLRFEKPAYDYDPNLLAGALTLTLTGYIPNVAGVAIYLRGEDGAYANLAGAKGYYSRTDFSDIIGANIYLPFPDAEGSTLYRVPRAVPGKSVYDPRVRLAELFKGPADPGVLYPLFTADDIESVYVIGELAVLNWQSGFSEKLAALMETEVFNLPKERRERLFVYSVVNTITEIPGIQRVWMLEDGKKLGAVQDIYLGNALMRNPGIMIDEG
ncbi:MAG: GerMN domain-containing protein [Candidatus Pelethousia sp.]|nr:GerMN domain-containing protein [Candidatus Pelethousia sp.]